VRRVASERVLAEASVSEPSVSEPSVSEPSVSERAAAEPAPEVDLRAASEPAPPGTERPVPKRSERVRKARAKSAAPGAPGRAGVGETPDERAADERANGARNDASSSGTSPPESVELLRAADGLELAPARPAARRRRRR
jgi:hypothetical protein